MGARALWLLPVLCALLVHGRALTGFFASDDLVFLARARGLDPSPWGWSRPLAGELRWELFVSWFGLDPRPHLMLALALHAVCALLVSRIARQCGLGRGPAIAAGVVLASSGIAYTSTHWATGLGEVMAAAFALLALALHGECRVRQRPALAWLAGIAAACAVLSKESVVLLPLAVFAFDRLVKVAGPGRGAVREIVGFGGLAGAVVVIGWYWSPSLAGEAYAMSFDPRLWWVCLTTYSGWLVRLTDPIRDRHALPDPSLLVSGSLTLMVWGWAAWRERFRSARPVTAGLVWFLLCLAPVVPLVRHAYLYYLVVPLAGVALAVAAAANDLLTRRMSGIARPLGVLLLALFVRNEWVQVRARESLMGGGVLVDRVARESSLLRRTLTELQSAHLAPGDSIVLVNPYPQVSVDPSRDAVRGAGSGFGEHSYIPLVSAVRGGRALELFVPGITVLGMGDGVPREWERARVFRFDNDGALTDLGRGLPVLDSLALDYIRGERWTDARVTLDRLVAHGADGPELYWRLGEVAAHRGDVASVERYTRVLIERWPDSAPGRRARQFAAAPAGARR